MTINMNVVMPVAAVVSSTLLLMAGDKRIFEIVALLASIAWLVVELGLFTWPLTHHYASQGIVIGAVLLVTGVSVYLNTTNKREVTASTVVAILGGTLLIPALNHLG